MMSRGLPFLCVLAALACKAPADVPDADPGDSGADEPSTATTAVTVFVEPGDNAKPLLDSIQGATSSIHMTMYLLTSNSYVTALIAKKKAGLDVKVVLNQNFPTPDQSNATVFSQLQAGGVDVVWAPPQFTYTHEKAVIVDGTSAWIMTMNVTFSSPSANREYLALDTDADDVAEAEQIFEADFANTAVTPAGKLVVAPDGARDALLTLVNGATTSLDVEGEELSDSAIVSAMVAAHDRGVTVRVVLSDDSPTSAQANAVQTLEADGIDVRKLSTPYVHAKTIVADGTLAYVGSENFTANSLDSNRELGLIVATVSEVSKIDATISGDFGAGVTY
ncbi:MAG TPA: phospholipase D-like domain-containing protein [Polyangiaceae bacterium]|jgi:phosphatidylserine/phosphatidylglycerophosphate/cardiolipin synthase-like enzyme